MSPSAGKTKNCELNKIKNVFLFTRDIHFDPTNLGFKSKSVEESINFVLQTKSSSCSAKHYLLGWLLQYYGIKVKYLTYPFYWHDLQISYPDNISQLLPELPIQYHLALSVLTDKGEWLLDATWDKGLLFAGFPVNELDNMRLGIIPCEKPVVHLSAQERWDYIEELKKTMPKSNVVFYFYKMMSGWLNMIRSSVPISNSNFPNVLPSDLSKT